MDTTRHNWLSPDLMADTQVILEHLTAGKPLDPETYRRIRARADSIRDEIFRQHGLVDIGVPAIRGLRDGDAQ